MHSVALFGAILAAGALAKPHDGHQQFHRRQEALVVETNVAVETAVVTVTATQGAAQPKWTPAAEPAAAPAPQSAAPAPVKEVQVPKAPAQTPSSTFSPPAASSAAPSVNTNSDVGSGDSDSAHYLALHNNWRQMHGAATMQWDASLASRAQAIVNSCPNGDKDDGQSPSVGSNWSGGTDLELFDALHMWYQEEPLYAAASGNYQSEPNGGGDWGHFSQVVWNDSTHVGCAKAACSSWGNQFTCLYYPQGNFAVENSSGQSNSYVENVFAPKVAGQ